MFLTLKRDPVWLYSLSQSSLDETLALLIGEDGCKVSVPAAILLAASPLVRSISSSGIHPAAVRPLILEKDEIVWNLIYKGVFFQNW